MGEKAETIRERELKFVEVEHDRLRDRLIEMEAERLWSSSLEENWIYDRKGELEGRGCVLRLRGDSQGAWLTFKGPAEFDDATKVRDELETRIDDPEAMRSILLGLGYRLVRRYEKKRETWRVGGVTVALDHTPIGDFAEFEGEAAEALAKRMGFDPTTAEKRNYLHLYDDYLRAHPDAPRDMTFAD